MGEKLKPMAKKASKLLVIDDDGYGPQRMERMV
jgi:hypothetical protein